MFDWMPIMSFQLVTIFEKRSRLDVWMGAECVFLADNYFSKKAPVYNWVPSTSFQPITIFEKSSSLDVWLGAKYVFSAGTIFEKSSDLDVCLGSEQTSPAVNPDCSYFFLNLPLHLLRRIL